MTRRFPLSGGGRPPTPLLGGVALLLVLAVVLAGCDNGSSNAKKPTTSGGPSTAAAVTDPAAVAVGAWVRSQGHAFAGDCSEASLPRDKGEWCATLVPGAGGPGEKVFDVGPVGEAPQKRVTVKAHTDASLHPGGQVPASNGTVGSPQQLSREQLEGDVWITGNLQADQQAGIGNGLGDLSGVPSGTTTTTTPGGGGGTGGGGTGTVDVGPQPYGNSGGIVVGTPTVDVGGEVTFRGGGCVPNETLTVTFDGTPVGTVPSDADGNFAGAITLPVGTRPGIHTVRITGSKCDLVFTVTVSGGLAFTGASSHTRTYVLTGFASVVVGAALVMGSRRRRTIRARRTG